VHGGLYNSPTVQAITPHGFESRRDRSSVYRLNVCDNVSCFGHTDTEFLQLAGCPTLKVFDIKRAGIDNLPTKPWMWPWTSPKSPTRARENKWRKLFGSCSRNISTNGSDLLPLNLLEDFFCRYMPQIIMRLSFLSFSFKS